MVIIKRKRRSKEAKKQNDKCKSKAERAPAWGQGKFTAGNVLVVSLSNNLIVIRVGGQISVKMLVMNQTNEDPRGERVMVASPGRSHISHRVFMSDKTKASNKKLNP